MATDACGNFKCGTSLFGELTNRQVLTILFLILDKTFSEASSVVKGGLGVAKTVSRRILSAETTEGRDTFSVLSCGSGRWSVVRVDHGKEMAPMHGMYGTLDDALEVQRSIMG